MVRTIGLSLYGVISKLKEGAKHCVSPERTKIGGVAGFIRACIVFALPVQAIVVMRLRVATRNELTFTLTLTPCTSELGSSICVVFASTLGAICSSHSSVELPSFSFDRLPSVLSPYFQVGKIRDFTDMS